MKNMCRNSPTLFRKRPNSPDSTHYLKQVGSTTAQGLYTQRSRAGGGSQSGYSSNHTNARGHSWYEVGGLVVGTAALGLALEERYERKQEKKAAVEDAKIAAAHRAKKIEAFDKILNSHEQLLVEQQRFYRQALTESETIEPQMRGNIK